MENLTEKVSEEVIKLQNLKDAQTAQIFGVASILITFCTCSNGGAAALVLGFLALKKAKKSITEYEENPHLYTEKSYHQAKSAKILAIIGMIVGALGVSYLIYSLIFGFAFDISNLG